MRMIWMGLALCLCGAVQAGELEGSDPAAIVAAAHRAAGGEVWKRPLTLHLRGRAELWQNGLAEAHSVADHYEMWREFPSWNAAAHQANGKVRIDARQGTRVLFQQSFDGEHSYNQNGRIDGAAASREWSEAFGFGIIRFALDEGFRLQLMADDLVDAQPCRVVKVIDPSGTETVFAIDRDSAAIRRVGFDTPRGWHERIYSDFRWLDDPGFQQPMRVRLYYQGVKTNDIQWQEARVNQPIDAAVFVIQPPASTPP